MFKKPIANYSIFQCTFFKKIQTTKDSNAPAGLATFNLDVQPSGVHEQTIELVDGSVIRFTISIPENYSDQTPSPLIVALHYAGNVTPFYGRGMIDNIVGPALNELQPIIISART